MSSPMKAVAAALLLGVPALVALSISGALSAASGSGDLGLVAVAIAVLGIAAALNPD